VALHGVEGVTPVRLDVDSDDSVREAVAQAGPVDVLVNNAGIGGGGPVELARLERAKRTFETNYFGALRMIQAVLPGMRAQGSGAIVNVTSMAGRVPLPGHSHYCASKFALDALSETLAAEVRPLGIRVAIVEPGVVLTPIFSKSRIMKLEDLHPYEMCIRRLRRLFDSQLRKKPTMPEEVAEAIAQAVFTTEPRLRYLVGRDAEVLSALRTRLSDEEWIRLHTIVDDREFGRALNEAAGFELYSEAD
jgi:NAD(P)-dependent dehydrogenase (short-subunit alcohol dehydrogenase family)